MVCLCAVSFVLTLSDPNPIQVPEIWIPISVVFGSYALLCSILAAYKLRLFIKQAGLEPSLPQIALFMEIFCGIGTPLLFLSSSASRTNGILIGCDSHKRNIWKPLLLHL